MDPKTEAAANLFRAGRDKMLLFDTEGYMLAVPLFLQAIEQKDFPEIHAALAETYYFWGTRRERNGEEHLSFFNLGFEEARAALETAPSLAAAHRAMAVALREGPMADANTRIVEASRACELDPDDGENFCELWRASGRDPESPLIGKALALGPRHCAVHIDLGVALCERGRLDEAAFHLWRALDLNPRNSLALYDLAMVELRMGQTNDALDTLLRAGLMHRNDPLLVAGIKLVKDELCRADAAAAPSPV